MKSTISRKVRMALASVAIACLAMTQTAQAVPTLSIRVGPNANNLQVYSDPNNPVGLTQQSSPTGIQYVYSNANFDGGLFNLNISITSNAPGTASLANLIDTSTTIRQNDTARQSDRVIEITVIDTGYTQPLDGTGGLILTSGFTATNGTPGPGGNLNAANGRIFGAVLVGNEVIIANERGLNNGVATSSFSNTNPFTLRNVMLISGPRSGYSVINAQGTVAVNDLTPTPTPEPATIALAFSGLTTLSLVGLRRRLARK